MLILNLLRSCSTSLRMQLLPYIYSTFAQYKFEGKPPFRAMNLVEGFGFTSIPDKGKLDGTKKPYAMSVKKDIKDQYMMGDYILVAPMFTGEKSRKVFLPAGKWYDFYTGQLAGENQVIEITPGLDKIPLFVKDGGVIPMITPQLQAPTATQVLPLIVRHYGKASCSFVLYDDDGISFNFEKGASSFTTLSIVKNERGGYTGTMSEAKTDKSFGYEKKVNWLFMTQ
ncbi:MAG: DUF5110 domain-containing protein [Saprospiraceae bacterium]